MGTLAVEDASPLVQHAWTNLTGHWKSDNIRIKPLAEFLAAADAQKLPAEAKQQIVEQAIFMFENLYPHLPFKRQIFDPADPGPRLKDLAARVATIAERDFHSELITSFAMVHDAHTMYGAPAPYRGAVAFLPFRMRYYLNDTGLHFVVTRMMPGFVHEHFGIGAEIFQWGLPILKYLELLAVRLPGGNLAAGLSRAVNSATLRPLGFCVPPDAGEDPAILEYRVPRSEEMRAISLPWGAVGGVADPSALAGAVFSLSPAQETSALWAEVLHPPASVPQPSSLPDPSVDVFEVFFTGGSRRKGSINIDDLFIPNRPDARVAYVKIKSFRSAGSTDGLVEEFRQILTVLDRHAPDGLVLDIRGNPGGNIEAAERMLQMLTPRKIEPALFHLANTPVMRSVLQRMAKQIRDGEAPDPPDLAPWVADAEKTDDVLTSGRPLTDRLNDIGQVYQGKVVLLIDALTYSAAEIFAGGFQDHSIGMVIGMDTNTGGGGANVWTHDELRENLGAHGLPLSELHCDASLSLAIRRSSRVRTQLGRPIEDVGVSTPLVYIPNTAEDVIAEFPGLIRLACQTLGGEVSRLDVEKFETHADGSVKLDLSLKDIDSVDVFLDGSLVLDDAKVKPPADGSSFPFDVPAAPGNTIPAKLRIEGSREGALAAVRIATLRSPAPDPDPGGGLELPADLGGGT